MNTINLFSNHPELSEIQLTLSSEHYSLGKLPIRDIVYQDVSYSLSVELQDSYFNYDTLAVIVNNQTVYTTDIIFGKNTYTFEGQYLFNMVYGITEIVIELSTDTEDILLFTPYLAIAVKKHYQQTTNSVKEMLEDIYTKEHALLHKAKLRNVGEIPQNYSYTDNKLEEEISAIREIIVALDSNWPYFKQNPRHATTLEQRVDSLEKLRNVTGSTVRYIATHPEQLIVNNRVSYTSTAKQFLPRKTLIEASGYTYITYENQAVISFIHTLIGHINNRIRTVDDVLKENGLTMILPDVVDTEYELSISIIYQYAKIVFQEYQSSLCESHTQLLDLLFRYKSIFPCQEEHMLQPPKPTPVFMEIRHYRTIYLLMASWFSQIDYNIPSRNILLHFSSADVIYEYYCLLNLYDAICSLGFIEDVSKRNRYEYHVQNSYYKETDIDNTYHFTKDGVELTLYYQPVLFSQRNVNNNEISLFRVDKSYFTPDFVVKKTQYGESSYAILDAKWRNRNAIVNNNVLQDITYKYYNSVGDFENGGSHAHMVWILQGKDDVRPQRIYRHRHSRISNQLSNAFINTIGIVQATPQVGTDELESVLGHFI